METNPLVLITCATGNAGNIGGHVALSLHRNGGFLIRIGARDINKATKMYKDTIPEATYVRLDLADASTFAAALHGVDKVFLGHPEYGFDELEKQQSFMDAVSAVTPKVPHVVKFTACASPEYVEIFDKHGPLLAPALKNIQQVVQEFKQKHGDKSISVVESPAWFYQEYISHYAELVQDGVLSIGNNDKALPRIDSRDIAEAIRAVLVNDGLNGSLISLTGAETLTESELAAELSSATGRAVVYSADVTKMQAQMSAVPLGEGLTLWDVTSELWTVEWHWNPPATAPRLSPDEFLRLTGKPFRTWAAFAAEYKDCPAWATNQKESASHAV